MSKSVPRLHFLDSKRSGQLSTAEPISLLKQISDI